MIRLPSCLSRPTPRRQDFRHLSNYLLACLSERARAPIRWAAARLSHGVAPTPPLAWRKGILLGPAHIGDVLYNTASLPALAAGLPDCQWTYVASTVSAAVLQGNPHLSRVSAVEDSKGIRAWQEGTRAALTGEPFDVAIAYGGGAWRDLKLAALLGIPNRVGYVHKGFSGLVTHPVWRDFPQPFPAYFRDLVCQITAQPREAIPSLRPRVYPGPEHEDAVNRMSVKRGIDWGKQPVLAVAVTSRQPSGIWPREKFLKCLQEIREKTPCTLIYIGARSDEADLTELARQTGADSFVLAGDLDLLSVVALLRRCRAALMTDSGLRHLANAAGLPVVFVRNISFRYEEAGPYCATDYDQAPPELELIPPSQQPSAWEKIDERKVVAKVIELLTHDARISVDQP